MNQEDLSFLLTASPAVQMLRSRSARWYLPFLYTVYKEESRFVINEELLIQLLTETLSVQEDGTEDFEEAKIIFGEDEETRSRKYILSWVQKKNPAGSAGCGRKRSIPVKRPYRKSISMADHAAGAQSRRYRKPV